MPQRSRAPDLFDRAWKAFGRAVTAPITENRRHLGLLAGALAAIAALLLSSPALFLNDYALDIFVPLDGAWRMHHGQWPHLDFTTPIGALYYVLLDLAGPGPLAPVRASVILLPLCFTAALVVTRARVPGPLRLGLVAFVSLLALSPRSLDTLTLVSHLASYNRHGWALTVIVFAAVLLEPRSRTRVDAAAEVALLTLCVFALFYLKITYFVLAGAVLIIGVIFGGANRTTSLATGVATLALVGLGFLLGETNAAYMADLLEAARAGSQASSSLIRTDRMAGIFYGNQASFLALFGSVVWLIRSAATEAEEQRASRESLRVLAACAVAVLITSQSHDSAMPVLPVMVVALFTVFRSRWELRGGDSWSVRVVGLAAFSLLAGTIACDTSAILRQVVGSRSASTAPLVALPDSPVSRIRIPAAGPGPSPLDRVIEGTLPPDAYDNVGPPWARDNDVILRDAVDLLQAHGVADQRVASLTFSPVFPWMLGTPPPRGLPAWHDYRRTFAEGEMGDLDRVLAEADVVLVPSVWRIEGIWVAYGDHVRRHYTRVGATPLWTLWVRNSPAN